MTISKENYKLESRLVELQNDLGEVKAKLDALVKNNMKPEDVSKIKLPSREGKPDAPSSTPYAIKPLQNPESTIVPPVVLPEGQTVPQALAAEKQERQDMSTIPAPKTPIEGDKEKETPIPAAPPLKPATQPKTPDEPMQ